jgi:murein L,D-transpeptidase YafK
MMRIRGLSNPKGYIVLERERMQACGELLRQLGFRKPGIFVLLLVFAGSLGCSARKTTLPPGALADRVVIVKSAHSMTLMAHGKVLRVYEVALGRKPGAKERRGDHKTPEGLYVVDGKNSKSRFDLALYISYPNAIDRARAKELGVDPGGDIEIHGLERPFSWLGSLHRLADWTDGCVAVTDAEIEEMWPLVPIGTAVEIRP